jgi:hypothetical protein
MASIQSYPYELDWLSAVTFGRGEDNSFLVTFCNACLRADGENYEVLRPVVHFFMGKYPADPERLAIERQESGATPPEGN